MTACAEQYSEHPLGKAVVSCYKMSQGKELSGAEDFKLVLGKGVSAVAEGKTVLAGNLKLLGDSGAELNSDKEAQSYIEKGCTVIYVAIDGKYAGFLALADTPRAESKDMIDSLTGLGYSRYFLQATMKMPQKL